MISICCIAMHWCRGFEFKNKAYCMQDLLRPFLVDSIDSSTIECFGYSVSAQASVVRSRYTTNLPFAPSLIRHGTRFLPNNRLRRQFCVSHAPPCMYESFAVCVQVIVFCSGDIEAFLSSTDIKDSGFDYSVVTVLGCQSSGKSELADG
jgi:hypothetical protein